MLEHQSFSTGSHPAEKSWKRISAEITPHVLWITQLVKKGLNGAKNTSNAKFRLHNMVNFSNFIWGSVGGRPLYFFPSVIYQEKNPTNNLS